MLFLVAKFSKWKTSEKLDYFSEYCSLGGRICKQCTVSSSLKVEYPPGLKGEKAAPHYDLNRAGRSIEQKAEKI